MKEGDLEDVMKKLDRGDWFLTIIYLLLNVGFLLSYQFELLDRSFIKEYYLVIGVLFLFLIFDIFHKRFRKKGMLIMWAIMGIIQLVIYYKYKDIPELQAANGNYINWMKAMPMTILVLFVLNLINKKLYGDHFIVTMLRLSKKDNEDERELRPIDYMFSLIGFLIIIFCVIL